MVALASSDQSLELALATVAHLSRYRGTSRQHTESDLQVFLAWCRERQLAPLTAQRHDLERRGLRMDRHAATRRLRQLATVAGIRLPRMHPHMLRHAFVTTMLDAGVDLRDVQIAARHPDPRTTMRYNRPQEPRPPPEQDSGGLHGVGHLTASADERVLSARPAPTGKAVSDRAAGARSRVAGPVLPMIPGNDNQHSVPGRYLGAIR